MRHIRSLKLKLGLSLIETAIVLAVIGLVIGGIWVAAAAVSEKMKMNTLVTGIRTAFNRADLAFQRQNVGIGVWLNTTAGWDMGLYSDTAAFERTGGLTDLYGNAHTVFLRTSYADWTIYPSNSVFSTSFCMNLVSRLASSTVAIALYGPVPSIITDPTALTAANCTGVTWMLLMPRRQY